MNLMDQVYALYARKQRADLLRTYVVACQHILNPRRQMLELISRFGIPNQNIYLVGKIYSTNYELLEILHQDGYKVFQPPLDPKVSFDSQHRQNCETLLEQVLRDVPDGARVIVLDDGAMLIKVFNERFQQLSQKKLELAAIEQTSSGYRILEALKLNFPVLNVARSKTKLGKETPFVAQVCISKIMSYLDRKHLEDRRFLVVGLGALGSQIKQQLQDGGFQVAGYDIKDAPDTFETVARMSRANVIIGVTGATSVTADQIETLCRFDYPIYLMSASSSDREFSAPKFRAAGSHDIHHDMAYQNLTFVNNGFPVNFNGQSDTKLDPNWILRTICLLLGSVLYLASLQDLHALPNGFSPVPEELADVL